MIVHLRLKEEAEQKEKQRKQDKAANKPKKMEESSDEDDPDCWVSGMILSSICSIFILNVLFIFD
jgi:hypothetical protein